MKLANYDQRSTEDFYTFSFARKNIKKKMNIQGGKQKKNIHRFNIVQTCENHIKHSLFDKK